jgi:hypothetical protein
MSVACYPFSVFYRLLQALGASATLNTLVIPPSAAMHQSSLKIPLIFSFVVLALSSPTHFHGEGSVSFVKHSRALTKKVEAGMLGALFPVPGASKKWTTLEGAPGALPLQASTLRPKRVSSEVPPVYGKFEAKPAIKAHYPAGSYSPGADAPRGGLSFYAPGPQDVDLTNAKEATFGYSVFFPQGFDFVRGGKLPGFCKSVLHRVRKTSGRLMNYCV